MSNVTDIQTRAWDAKADCPIPWCTGTIESHGGDGATASQFIHSQDNRDLSGIAKGARCRQGEEPTGFYLVIDQEGECSPEELRDLAKNLSRLSLELLQIAAELDIENAVVN